MVSRFVPSLLLTVYLVAPAQANAPGLPADARARAIPIPQTYFGKTVVDPYHWMEAGPSDPTVLAFLKAQNAYTRATLDKLSAPRAKLLARIETIANAVPQTNLWQRGGSRVFFREIAPGQSNAVLRVRDANGTARTLLDPQTLATNGAHAAIDYFTPSTDGRYVIAGVSLGGSENSTLRVIDANSGVVLSDAITRTQYAAPAWRPDSKSFYYARLQELPSGAPPTAIYENERTFLHVIGHPIQTDVAVFGNGVAIGADVPKAGFTGIQTSPDSRYAVASYSAGTTDNAALWVAPLAKATNAATAWHPLVTSAEQLSTVDAPAVLRGSTLYLLLEKDAPNRKVVAYDLDRPERAPRTVISAGDATYEGIYGASDALYIVARNGVNTSLLRLLYASGAKASPLALPAQGSLFDIDASTERPGLLFGLSGWITPPRAYVYDPTSGFVDTNLQVKNPTDLSSFEAREVMIPSSDGASVPLSIIARKGLPLDGSHPTFFEGYGAYGFSIDPMFNARDILAWVERGGVVAVVHARGGGEFGVRWHEAGQKATKQHTVDDGIAAAHYLIDQKYTSPSHLGIRGTSAGGIFVGNAIVQHPELFAAAIDNVGMTNLVRFQTTQGGAANVPEFGDITNGSDFPWMFAVSPYQHVVDGTKYPALLAITGANDPRVPPWMPAQFAARLQSASTSERPVLLRVDFDAGHGLGSARDQRERQTADEWTFMLWQFGDPEFQPAQQPPRKP